MGRHKHLLSARKLNDSFEYFIKDRILYCILPEIVVQRSLLTILTPISRLKVRRNPRIRGSYTALINATPTSSKCQECQHHLLSTATTEPARRFLIRAESAEGLSGDVGLPVSVGVGPSQLPCRLDYVACTNKKLHQVEKQ